MASESIARVGENSRCVLYIRVSSIDQNPDLQHRELTEYAALRGWQIVQVFEDRLSGTNANRKHLQALMSQARQRKFDILLVWKLDRAFRSLRDCINYMQELSDLGVQFVSLKDNGIDMTLPSGRLLLHILAAFSEFEASICKMRVMAGLQAARARGIRLGRPSALTPEIEREIIRLRFEAKLSFRGIEKKLNKLVSKATCERVINDFLRSKPNGTKPSSGEDL